MICALDCLENDELCAWIDGSCDERATLAVESHLEGCHSCDELLAALVELHGPPVDRSGNALVLQCGESLGRYRILGILGAGAMGVVYSARDETLDRTIALKLLGAAHSASPEAAARLAREAQAMARLSHPNVVAVYEIGTFEGAPFVAMEHVDGVTLSEWLRERRPKIDETVRLFREAAIGLEAVHRAGLVHRDFKPANVLVSRDGRVRIADFGLVHLVTAPAMRPDGSEPATSAVTAAGAVIGTPAYLAPEQFEGRVDARSDQFSFCVALFEACFGHRPFPAATLQELATAVRSGVLQLPTVLPRGTRWLVPILRRGLEYDPAARFPDLGALVVALSRSPARRRRRLLTGAIAIAGMGGVLFGLNAARGPDCTKIERALDGVWDPPRREAIRAAFLSKDLHRAAQAWEKVSTALDTYATEWVGRRREACLHPGKDDATRGLVAAKVACLDRRIADLRVLSELLVSSDMNAAENAPHAVSELRAVDSCDRAVAGETDLSKDEKAVLERLTEVRLLSFVGRLNPARDLAQKVLQESERARPAVRAKALLRSGQVELEGSFELGVAQLQQAALLAETAREDEVRAEALTYLVLAMSRRTSASDLALGEQYAAQATAVLARLGGDRRLDPLLRVFRGALLRASDRYDEAVTQLEQALGMLERDPMRDPSLLGRVVSALGITLGEMGRPKESVPYFERDLALMEGSVGARSPALFTPELNLGDALLRSGRIQDAAPHLERALALAEIGEGADGRRSAVAALVLGICRAEQGDTAAAGRLLERAVAISSNLPSEDQLRFEVQLELGRHLTKTGNTTRAQALLKQALRDSPPGQEHIAEARFALAQALPRTEHKQARELASQARATYAQAGARRQKEVAAIDAWLAKGAARQ